LNEHYPVTTIWNILFSFCITCFYVFWYVHQRFCVEHDVHVVIMHDMCQSYMKQDIIAISKHVVSITCFLF